MVEEGTPAPAFSLTGDTDAPPMFGQTCCGFAHLS
jgi:hypothetical protein